MELWRNCANSLVELQLGTLVTVWIRCSGHPGFHIERRMLPEAVLLQVLDWGEHGRAGIRPVDKLTEYSQVASPSSDVRSRPMRCAKEGSSRSIPETRSRLWMTVEWSRPPKAAPISTS